VARSRALLINLGTPDDAVVAGIRVAVAAARQARAPWALDPVGVAASPWRLALARELLASHPAIIRGNADEIVALARGEASSGAGIDAISTVASALDAARQLAERTGAVIAVTGAEDVVLAPGAEAVTLVGGHPMSRLVSGAGCAATALMAAGLAVAPAQDAAIAGLALMKRAAAEAGREASGPGSFAVALIDALHRCSREADPHNPDIAS
jgi:hydroxyethylthiazole kinase